MSGLKAKSKYYGGLVILLLLAVGSVLILIFAQPATPGPTNLASPSLVSTAKKVPQGTPLDKFSAVDLVNLPTGQQSSESTKSSAVQSMNTAKDLWMIVVAAQNSGSLSGLYEARAALRECGGIAMQFDAIQLFISGHTGPYSFVGENTQVRRDAFSSLLAKCDSFRRAGQALVANTKKDTAEQIEGIAPWLSESENSRTNTVERANRLISIGGAEAIRDGLAIVGVLLSEEISSRADSRAGAVAHFAALASACDLGRNCTASGLDSEINCAFTGVCNLPWPSSMTSQLTPDEVRRFDQIKGRIVGAVRDHRAISLALLAGD
jgi:hypothetical protein